MIRKNIESRHPGIAEERRIDPRQDSEMPAQNDNMLRKIIK
jgi:hypothetical protein